MQRRSLLAAALAAFLPVRVSPFPAMPMVNAVATGGTGDGAWFYSRLHAGDLYSRAEVEARGEWPPAPLRTGEIGRIERFTIHNSEVL